MVFTTSYVGAMHHVSVLTTIIPIRKIDWVSNGVNGGVLEGGNGVTIRIMV